MHQKPVTSLRGLSKWGYLGYGSGGEDVRIEGRGAPFHTEPLKTHPQKIHHVELLGADGEPVPTRDSSSTLNPQISAKLLSWKMREVDCKRKKLA